jgi:hypothetical protein
MRNDLHGDIFRLRARLVTHVVDVPAAQIREALAYTVVLERAVVVVHRERSLCDCDLTRTGMGVPPSLTAGLERDLGNVDV